jgi:hypothetical protein
MRMFAGGVSMNCRFCDFAAGSVYNAAGRQWRRCRIAAMIRSTRYLAAASVAMMVSQTACGWGASDAVVTDLVKHFHEAKKQPSDAAFSISDIGIDGQTRTSIVSRGSTRLTFHVTVPIRGRFRVFLASPPDSWVQIGGGLLILVGISDGHTYRDVESRHLNPHEKTTDRHWQEIQVDLVEYEGMTIDLILNVRVPTAGSELAVWGSPAIVVR